MSEKLFVIMEVRQGGGVYEKPWLGSSTGPYFVPADDALASEIIRINPERVIPASRLRYVFGDLPEGSKTFSPVNGWVDAGTYQPVASLILSPLQQNDRPACRPLGCVGGGDASSDPFEAAAIDKEGIEEDPH